MLGGWYVHPASTVNAEQWNGTSWTEVANLNVAEFATGGTAGAKSRKLAIMVGGKKVISRYL